MDEKRAKALIDRRLEEVAARKRAGRPVDPDRRARVDRRLSGNRKRREKHGTPDPAPSYVTRRRADPLPTKPNELMRRKADQIDLERKLRDNETWFIMVSLLAVALAAFVINIEFMHGQ